MRSAKNLKRLTEGDHGYVLVVSTVVLLATAVMGVAMMQISRRNRMATNTVKEKVKHFYAADGIMAMLAQEALNGNIFAYLKWDTLDIDDMLHICGTNTGSYTTSGDTVDITSYGCNSLNGAGEPDSVSLAYTRLGGDFDVRVELASLSADPELCYYTNAGIMIRNQDHPKSKMAYVYATAGGYVEMITRREFDGSIVRFGYTAASTPLWLGITRIGNRIQCKYSRDGFKWSTAGEDIVSMDDSLYVGIYASKSTPEHKAWCSVLETRVSAEFNRFSVLSSSPRYDTLNDASVEYTLAFVPPNLIKINAAAVTRGKDGNAFYSSPLELLFDQRGLQFFGADLVKYDVIVYDYKHDDFSNPNFNHCFCQTADLGDAEDTLTSDRKPVLRHSYNVGDCRGPDCNEAGDGQDNVQEVGGYAGSAGDTECNHKFNEFFRLSGTNGPDSSVSFHYSDARERWEWARVSDSMPVSTSYGGSSEEFTGPHFDPTYEMANVFWYDSIFFNYDPEVNEYWVVDTLPIQTSGRGFGNETHAGCNPGWCMELHTEFEYKGGERLSLTTDHGDLVVYINGHIVFNEVGPTHNATWSAATGEVVLDDIADDLEIVQGGTYMFDLFRCQRNECAMDKNPWAGGTTDADGNGNALGFRMRTNLNFKETLARRSWKRDLGELD